MARNVTAIYRTREVADLVCRGLEDIGIARSDIHVIPDGADVRAAGAEHPLEGSGYLAGPAEMDRLHELHLPEDDLRTYQQCVRRGDHVVSAEVDDDQVEKVKAIMRRPETEVYDIEHRASEFTADDLIAHSAGEGHMLNEEWRARRIAAGEDPYLRTYERDRRLFGRI